MAVQTYWDLSERERAELSREELDRFCDAELMTKGVLRVGPTPTLEPEPPMPAGSLRVWRVRARDVRYGYGRTDLGSICFATHELAAAFVALGPMAISSDYMGGSLTLDSAKPAEDVEIYEATVLSERELERARAVAKTSVAVREANERAKKDHAAAVKARDEALASMFADWSECRARADRLRHVLTTWREYVTTCNGDEAIAATFLGKVFPANDIDQSREWFASEWTDVVSRSGAKLLGSAANDSGPASDCPPPGALTISTFDDLSAWLDSMGRIRAYAAVLADLSTVERSGLLDRITIASPRWGADWGPYLKSLDIVAMAAAVRQEMAEVAHAF